MALGAALLAISFVHSEQKPILSSALLAYGLFLPLSAAGFELGINAVASLVEWPARLPRPSGSGNPGGGDCSGSVAFQTSKSQWLHSSCFDRIAFPNHTCIFTGLTTIIRDGITAARRIEPTPTLLSLPSVTPTLSPNL